MIILKKLRELGIKYSFEEESRSVRFVTTPEKIDEIVGSDAFRALEYLTVEPKIIVDEVPKDFKKVKVEGEVRWYKRVKEGVIVALKTKKGYEVKVTTKSLMADYVVKDLYPSLFYYSLPFEINYYRKALEILRKVRPSHGSS